ncbi:MAG: NAD(P)H-hydrate dehydratase [FCB group bacterium]|nr:NAD(P)H-hydrate dehydratase [FCB group bacterium]
MLPLVTRHQSQELDRIAIVEHQIPGITLMGNAGNAVAEWVLSHSHPEQTPETVGIVCGKGNNGGDGFAAAVTLKAAGVPVYIFSLAGDDLIQGDSRHFYSECVKQSIPINFQQAPPQDTHYDWIIDAILGTGFHGELRDSIRQWTRWINQAGNQILSVDIPTGVDADTGCTSTDSVHADVTITMGYCKTGMTLEPGKSACGEVIPVDIGFPDIYEQLPGRKYSLYQKTDARNALPFLKPETHKHNQGKVLLIAGSKGMTGAAALATFGALRSGAGLTVTLAPESLEPTYESLILEGMTCGIPDQGKGCFTPDGLDRVLEWLEWCDAVIVGPGLGRHPETRAFLTELLPLIQKPFVLDADGFQPLISKALHFHDLKARFIITPHYGEWAQLGCFPKVNIRSQFQEMLGSFMENFPGVLALKNAPTCICHENQVVVNNTGNPGLATAGSGDVFAGVCGTFLSQGLRADQAASLAAFIHGQAGDRFAEERGMRGMIASDLLSFIPMVLHELENPS